MFVCVLPGIAVRLLVVNDETGVQDSAEEKKIYDFRDPTRKAMMNPQTSISL